MTKSDINFWLFFAWAVSLTAYTFHLSAEIEDTKHRIRALSSLLWGNYEDIKRLRVQLEAVEIKQRELANDKEWNASDGTLSGRPHIQCSCGYPPARGTGETQRAISELFQKLEHPKGKTPGTGTEPKRNTEKGT